MWATFAIMRSGGCINSEPVEYHSAFHDWDERSSIRAKTRRRFQIEKEEGKCFFCPSLVPISQHRLVTERGNEVVSEVLARHLIKYLTFTEILEHEVVNQVTFKIARGLFQEILPPGMRRDAWIIYRDESHHAGCSGELIEDIMAVFHWKERPHRDPAFLTLLKEDLVKLSPQERCLVESFFAFVSETLITGSLTKIPADPNVFSTIRTVIGDHAADEAKHHAYFTEFLYRMWPKLSERQRQLIGPRFVQFITYFLSPDCEADRALLIDSGFASREAEQIVNEVNEPAKRSKMIVEGSVATLRHLANVGVFEMTEVQDSFAAAGLHWGAK